jgi:hypothetical protein
MPYGLASCLIYPARATEWHSDRSIANLFSCVGRGGTVLSASCGVLQQLEVFVHVADDFPLNL